jgi:RNase P subunit RPR2
MSACLGIAPCGATERTGARFANTLKRTTCPDCIRLILALRAKARAEFEAVGR